MKFYKMGSDEDKKPKRGTTCFKLIIIVLLMTGFIIPARGFFMKTCKISKNRAKCVKSKLKTVPQDVPPMVTGFDLSVNKLSRIQPSDFTPLPVLIHLDLNRNHISQIDSFAFASLISLQKLNLNNNKLVKLEENVFDGLGNLTELRINYNHIKVVSSSSFQSLMRLKLLDISKNKLRKLTTLRLVLQHLPQLQELVLQRNGLTSFRSWELTNRSLELGALDLSLNPITDFRITTDIFPNLVRFMIGDPFSKTLMKWDVQNKTFLSRVSKLDISGLHMALDDMKAVLEAVNSSLTYLKINGIKHNLSTLIDISCTVPTMTSLQVRRNQLKSISVDYFKLCVDVTELDLSQNQIKEIQENAFASLKGLTVLSLSRNNLLSVPSAMRNLQNLLDLDLSFNRISAVECQDLSSQTKLTQLNLKNNSFPSLKNCAFKDLVKLQVLKLQSCDITNLNGAFEKHLPNLKCLQLNGNKLTTIKKGELRGLQSLVNLSLHENQIKNLNRNSFFGLTSLSSIKLQSNRITRQDLNTGALNSLINLQKLDLSDNHIKYFENSAMSQPPFSNLLHLEELSITTQHLKGKTHLPRNFLEGLTNLSSFSVRNIQLTYLDKDTFTYTPKLTTLDVSSNDLSNLPAELFSPIQNLKSLYISRISLQSLDFFVKANLRQVDFLQATHNQYSVITSDVIQSLPSLKYVNLEGNSFSCDCHNAWFLNWTKNSPQTQVVGACDFVCNYPDDFIGKKLLDFDPTSCSVDTGFICFVLTTCMTLCFMVASFTYHFMRWQLYCAYYLFLAWLYDKKHENKQSSYQYDAFISYNTHDEPWVVGELLPKLEGEQGWRLCLHHRDFEPGKPIIDNITDAIYGSRKTICVISRRYLESEWCSREVQKASFRLFDEKKDVLILVFLEDIPSYLLSSYHRMRKLLKKQTYLSWLRAAEHPEVFWEKLRKALQTGDDLNEKNLNIITIEIKNPPRTLRTNTVDFRSRERLMSYQDQKVSVQRFRFITESCVFTFFPPGRR